MKTWLITGGSSGFGMAYAHAALANGDQVVLTARNPDHLQGWADRHPHRALTLPLDITDPIQVTDAVAKAEAHFGGIDHRPGEYV